MSTAPIYEPGPVYPAWLVELFRGTFTLLFNLLTRWEMRGRENLPAGAFIMAPNHLSYIDPPLVFIALKGYPIAVFAADTYRGHWFSWVLRLGDIIWVNRGAITPAVIKASVRVLRAGRCLGLAPEGTRSRVTHALQPGKTGAAFLACLAGVPVVPVAVAGTHRAFSALKRGRRAEISITFGKPIVFPALPHGRHPDTQTLENYTTEIMCQLAALLPPDQRGVYADHPRLQALLAGQN